MTTLPAVVRIVDLPVATTITGAELFEVVQTSAGVGLSVQVSLSNAVAPLGVLPTGGGTSQILAKSSPTNYSAAWYDVTQFLSVNTASALVTSGTGTALVIGVPSGGIGSTQLGANAVQRTNVTAFAIGSGQIDTSGVIRASIAALAVGSAQLDVGAVLRTNLTSFLIGSTQLDTASIGTAQIVVGALGMTLLNTLSPNGVASTNDTTSFTSTYRNYLFTFENICPATNTTFLQMQFATTGSNFISGSYVSSADAIVGGAAAIDTSTTVLLLTGARATTSLQTTTVAGVSGFIRLFNPSSSSIRKQITGELNYASTNAATLGTTSYALALIWGLFDGNSNAVTGVNFLFNSGNIATGTIKIYGSP